MPTIRVTADEFLSRLVTAAGWELLHNAREGHILELWVVEGEAVQCYTAPDFLDMTTLQVKVFFQRLNEFLADPEMVKKRVKNYRDQKEALA